jgi:hypothetical protein
MESPSIKTRMTQPHQVKFIALNDQTFNLIVVYSLKPSFNQILNHISKLNELFKEQKNLMQSKLKFINK